jgi:hypothetical protein
VAAMAARFLYATPQGGTPLFYVDGDAVFSMDGKPAFYIADGRLFTYEGKPAYTIDGDLLYRDGKAEMYFG